MKRATRLNATWIALLSSLTMAGGQTAAPAPDAPPSPALFANPAPALAEPTATSIPSPTMAIINSAKVTDTGGNDGISPVVIRAEVMLDRVHASPGVIDGRDGENFVHALEIYEKAKGLKAPSLKRWATATHPRRSVRCSTWARTCWRRSILVSISRRLAPRFSLPGSSDSRSTAR